ncbi:MAG: DUF2871 domain-containing protein [Microlunatus sp.]|nr:DUF2871 domain-containing protein [Microlunatus sp.]
MLATLYRSALTWTVVGLASGLFYREFTKAYDFTGTTRLAVLHTHALVLGTLVMLLVLALTKLFGLAEARPLRWFVWVWNIGLALMLATTAVKGVAQVTGSAVSDGPAFAGVSGLSHMILTAGFVLLFWVLRRPVTSSTSKPVAEPEAALR